MLDLKHVPGPNPSYLLKFSSPTWIILQHAIYDGQYESEVKNGSLKIYSYSEEDVVIPKNVYEDLVAFIKDKTAKAYQFIAHDSDRVLMCTGAGRNKDKK